MVYNKTTSFSQNRMFEQCNRAWYYKYIKKIPIIQDMCYAHGGSVIHSVIEKHYSNKYENLDEAKKDFEIEWNKSKYKLNESKIRLKKDSYWLMCLNAFNLKKNITTTELKIFYPDAVAYIDAIDTENDEIMDWKSSTRSKENEEEYKVQVSFYSYMYKRKFGRLPKKATLYYLKYSGTKGELSFEPTEKDILRAESWHLTQRLNMARVVMHGKVPPVCDNCFYFCPYKNMCNIGDDGSVKFDLHIKGNDIHISGAIGELLNVGLTKKFSYELKNAYFMKKRYPDMNTIVNFWNYRNRTLPIGFMSGLKTTLEHYAKHISKKQNREVELKLNIKDHREFNQSEIEMPEKFINGVVLRDYQNDAVKTFLENKISILEIGTGGGKTEIAIEIIRRLGMRTLFIVDKIELMRQTKERIEKSLGIEVGQIGQSVVDIKPVTVATVQTLTKHLSTHAPYLRSIRVCIFDETHKVAAKSYYRLSRQLISTEYRLGISGTAFRDDGNDMMINASTGYKVFDLSSKILIERGWLVKPQIKFIKDYMTKDQIDTIEREAKTGLINETPNYTNYYNYFISQNIHRNAALGEVIEQNKDKKILILTKLIEHGMELNKTFQNSEHLYGGTPKEERAKMFDEFVNGDLQILISTISIFAEGIDVPILDGVINAAANKGDVKTIQVLGRVLRKMAGKSNALYVDFIDETKFFRSASLARKRALTKEGHDVEVIDYGELQSK